MSALKTGTSTRRLAGVAGLWVLYVAAFPVGHGSVLNDMYVAASIIPAIRTAHVLGIRGARVIAILFYPLHALLFYAGGHEIGIDLFAGVEGAIGMLVIPMVALYAGNASDLRRRLEAVDAAKDRFIATVAHDVKNPLTGVLGLAIALRDEPGLPPYARDLAAMVADEAQAAADIVEDLSVTALRNSGQFQVHPEAFDLAQEVWAACRTNPDISVEADGDPQAFADPRRVRQILNNLISNAFRHGAPPIDVRVATTGLGATVEITDRGPGIPPEAVEGLFEPFAMVGVSGHVDSTGLGLSSSRVLATLMGGDLAYIRSPGSTTFRLTLPRSAETEAPRQKATQAVR